ncbi:hypothetical protein [Natrinema gari]|uniref:Uncharacterized protein n=1 Tax=Natrinema gari JCM 14663 TaxID=1230459 RepID=L9ZJR5_9EURY|nr:hypothetical protein [Natrinema gari]ELY85413.1 hypothetical protein C486_00040 [Natrinema gari JCM 14663]
MNADQTTLEAVGDTPEIGVTLEKRTHYAHTRYAASETAGVIWYDPRDGRENYAVPNPTPEDALAVGEDTMTRVKIRPHRPASHGDPADRYVVNYSVVRKVEIDTTTEGWVAPNLPDTYVDTRTYGGSEVFDSLEAAREYCRENVPGYADAPRKDAVRARGER